MYEQPPGRRRIGPVLIAVLVVLAAAAGTGAYFVARQILTGRGGEAAAANNPATPAAGTDQAPSTPTPARATPTGPQTIAKVTPKPADAGTSCPSITAKALSDAGLNSQLKLLRYVAASLPGGSDAEAWICKNAAGELFYQGHRMTGPFEAATSNDTILLGRGIVGEVNTEGTDGFIAINPMDPVDPDRTEYHVSPKAFSFVVLPDGGKTEYVLTRTVG